MPRRWRWLVPITALIACFPRAGASAAPQPLTDLPIPAAEERAARMAQAATLRAHCGLTASVSCSPSQERLAPLLRAMAHRRQQRRARAAQAEEADGVVKTAKAQIGDGYASGGTGPDAFDCSGLTAYAFAGARVALPHSSHSQAALGRPVKRADIRPGDLVFFSTAGPGASHVGIATGPSTVVSATNSGVMEHPANDAYWGGHYVGARRIL
jgi:cell wall-associated NlpC family hydrolase